MSALFVPRAEGTPSARSRHPGVVNACFCDGSVRTIENSIDRTTWLSYWTRAGHEVPVINE